MSYEDRLRWHTRWLGAIVLGGCMAGCSAMQGINVGASIPIGPVSVGASKTIEGGPAPAPAPAPSQKKTSTDKSDDS